MTANQFKEDKGAAKKVRKQVTENHLLVNEKGDVGMVKRFSKKYENKGRAFN